MGKLKTLVLGDGLLGKEIVKQTGWDFISRKKDGFDINKDFDLDDYIIDNYDSTIFWRKYDTIINCIANTNTYSTDKDSHWNANYVFVDKLIKYCNNLGIKLVHISTDYVYTNSNNNASENDVPVHCNNWYGYTKLLGDALVQLQSNDYLVCRCTHKPTPFPYDSAWIDQVGNFDYVDKISSLIIDCVNNNLSGVYNVGTETKTIYELAKETKNVNKIFSPINVPKNTSMNLSKMNLSLKKTPFFSISIPTYGYNGKGVEFLEFSFNKLYEQSFKDFEIVISDHSTDDTIKSVCDNWKDKLNIIHFFNEKGRGIISPNINESMKNCNGKWIKILFQDDFLYDSKSLETQFNFINKNENLIWFVSKFYHSDDGINFYRLFLPEWNELIWTGNNTMGCPSGVTIKNENLLFFDEELNWLMDCDFYTRMKIKFGTPLILDEITVVNRTWGERLTDTIPQELKDKEFDMLKLKYA
jgi:dTDP-4-dehydrorhamnose reductase